MALQLTVKIVKVWSAEKTLKKSKTLKNYFQKLIVKCKKDFGKIQHFEKLFPESQCEVRKDLGKTYLYKDLVQ